MGVGRMAGEVHPLRSGFLGYDREIRAGFAYFGEATAEFLCIKDLLAERKTFEPSVQVVEP